MSVILEGNGHSIHCKSPSEKAIWLCYEKPLISAHTLWLYHLTSKNLSLGNNYFLIHKDSVNSSTFILITARKQNELHEHRQELEHVTPVLLWHGNAVQPLNTRPSGLFVNGEKRSRCVPCKNRLHNSVWILLLTCFFFFSNEKYH